MRSSNDYSTAADEIHRAPYLAAADCASALLTFYLMVIPAVGELLAGIVTLKAGFRKGVPLDRGHHGRSRYSPRRASFRW